MTITAAADGSALGNPGAMGWAWYVDDECWGAGGSAHGTNNQGELTAVLELLRATEGADDDLLVECDSRYVIDALTKWMPGWKRKNWRKADGKPVLNRDLMEALDEALSGRSVRFEWVRGHAGHPLNEMADSKANAAARSFQDGTPLQSGPGFGGANQVAKTNVRPVVSETPATLFDDLDDVGSPQDSGDDLVEFRVTLTADEHARLRARSAYEGVSAEELLRSLI